MVWDFFIIFATKFVGLQNDRKDMKKILFAIAIVMMLGMTASAQKGMDGFFDGYYNINSDRMDNPNGLHLPTDSIGSTENSDASLGTGLLIMTALGAGYAFIFCSMKNQFKTLKR